MSPGDIRHFSYFFYIVLNSIIINVYCVKSYLGYPKMIYTGYGQNLYFKKLNATQSLHRIPILKSFLRIVFFVTSSRLDLKNAIQIMRSRIRQVLVQNCSIAVI